MKYKEIAYMLFLSLRFFLAISECPTGSYNNVQSDGTDLCTPCFECRSDGLDTFTDHPCTKTHDAFCKFCSVKCASGYYESTACTANGNRNCTLCRSECPAGTYETNPCNVSSSRDRECTICPAGWYCTGGSTDKIQCPVNKNSSTGSSSNIDCRCIPGYYTNYPSCSICPAGWYCTGGGNIAQCSSGFSSPLGSSSATACGCTIGKHLFGGLCYDCGGATYSNFIGATVCKDCSICGPGKYQTNPCTATTDTECPSCGPLSYSKLPHNAECLSCSTLTVSMGKYISNCGGNSSGTTLQCVKTTLT